MKTASSISEVVRSGLCIGCGLCEAVTDGRVRMIETEQGSLRPDPSAEFSLDEEALLLKACPGVRIEVPTKDASHFDEVWGGYETMAEAYAADPDIRHRAATGGVLTALGVHLLKAGKVAFILQVRADPDRPMRSIFVMSETAEDVKAATGSRYGPVAPLAGLEAALQREEPFAVIAKPCDLNALFNLARSDPRIDRYCRFRLAMVCGGQSRLTKSRALLEEFGVREEDLTLFRYRGYGNPGLTRVETRDGSAFTKTYNQLWEDEGTWEIETRCKICPDALGECADVAAADIWPGGAPEGEDEGFNGIITRNQPGVDLVADAETAGDLVVGKDLSVAEFNDFQPHQVRKKHALLPRLQGMAEAGSAVLDIDRTRYQRLSENLTVDDFKAQKNGAFDRVKSGRFSEG
ncbi:MAG: Coenzyme F420 hydrogenase/dehydrogenase, beta subunit C-terminal domain [Pseudomonadota bacterium]